jgi:hypothetical protein
MKIKIIKDEDVLKGNIIQTVDNLNQSVLAISETKKEICEEFIRFNQGEKYFDEPISAKVYIDYPLSVTTEIEVKNIETIGELLWNIAKVYKQIYTEEDKSTKIKPGQLSENIINRNQTDGKYGINFHDLGDLVFELIHIHDNGTIHIHVGS